MYAIRSYYAFEYENKTKNEQTETVDELKVTVAQALVAFAVPKNVIQGKW